MFFMVFVLASTFPARLPYPPSDPDFAATSWGRWKERDREFSNPGEGRRAVEVVPTFNRRYKKRWNGKGEMG